MAKRYQFLRLEKNTVVNLTYELINIHKALATEAARAGISLNALVAQKMALQADRLRETVKKSY